MDGSTASHWEDARLFIDICAIPLEFWFSTLWFFFLAALKKVFLYWRHLCFRNEWEALSSTAGALGFFFGEGKRGAVSLK